MTIADIEKSLPNGFHDSNLKRIDIDYATRQGDLEFEVNTGSLDTNRENYRLGKLSISGLLFCIIETPDSRYPFQKAEGLWIADSGIVETAKFPNKLPESLPEGAFAHYFFVNDWNAFIYIAAMDASFGWGSDGD